MLTTPDRTPVTGLRGEWRDFLCFVRSPRLGPRLPRMAMSAPAADWIGSLHLPRILRWVVLLWVANLLVFGPLAAGAAFFSGAGHRFDPANLPWVLALLWAPVVEELMFRYGMRRPGAALWLLPSFVLVVQQGSTLTVGLVLAVSLALVLSGRLPGVAWSFRLNRRYRQLFPWVFHALTVAFAVLHLLNFQLGAAAWWMLPLLVLPQWVTGLVLGWLRVRSGIGASMLAHSFFNAGPLLLVWLVMSGSA